MVMKVQRVNSKNPISNIQEEVQFDNPRIIFRRIKGRIVPIVNKRQVGKDLSGLGNRAAAIGATLGAGAIAGVAAKRSFKRFKTTKPVRKIRKAEKIFKRISRKSGVFDFSKAKNVIPKKVSLPKKAISFGFKNPLLAAAGIGAGLVATGFAAKAAGFELQAETRFGARF